VIVQGKWDHEHSVLVGPRVKDGLQGFQVITPLKRPNGSTILVDRGFVEKEISNAVLKPREDGPVEITGMLRLQPKGNAFTPENDPDKGLWYWPDINKLVAHAGGTSANVQPVLMEAICDKDVGNRLIDLRQGIPVGRAPVVDIRNEHATYFVIWYSLSAATSVMFWMLLKKPPKPRFRSLS